MRQVRDALHRPLDRSAENAVEDERQNQRCWERKNQLQKLNLDRVDQGQLEVPVSEQTTEVLQTDKRAVTNAEKGRKVLKGDDVAQQGQILKNEEVQRAGDDERIDPALPSHALPQRRPVP